MLVGGVVRSRTMIGRMSFHKHFCYQKPVSSEVLWFSRTFRRREPGHRRFCSERQEETKDRFIGSSRFLGTKYSQGFSPSHRFRRVLSVLLYHQPGCLAEIAKEIGDLDLNIDGLSLGDAEIPELRKMTSVIYCTDDEAEQVRIQLLSLVSVAHAEVSVTSEAVGGVAEVTQMLVKVSTVPLTGRSQRSVSKRMELAKLVNVYGASVIDVTGDKVLLLITGAPPHIDSFVEILKGSFVIVEIQRSGSLAMTYLNDRVDGEGAKRTMAAAVEQERSTLLSHSAALPFRADASLDSPLLPTCELYRDAETGEYSKARQVLHRSIIGHFLGRAPVNQEKPLALFLIGAPGAGKDSIMPYLPALANRDHRDLVRVNVDDVMALLPDFTRPLLHIGMGRVGCVASGVAGEASTTTTTTDDIGPEMPTLDAHTRYGLCRAEAKELCETLLTRVMEERRHMIFHGTAREFERYRDMLQRFVAAHYHVQLVGVHVNADMAVRRVKRRARKHGRDVPADVVRAAVHRLQTNFRPLADMIDNAVLFDSGAGRPAKMVWSKDEGRAAILRPHSVAVRQYGLRVQPTSHPAVCAAHE